MKRDRGSRWRPPLALNCLFGQLFIHLSTVTSVDVDKVILVKIGGSSITHKGDFESLNEEAVEWFAESIFNASSSDFLAPTEECAANNSSQLLLRWESIF